jgi:hypothetical protein
MEMSYEDGSGRSAVPWSTIKSWTKVSSERCIGLIGEKRSLVVRYRNVVVVVAPVAKAASNFRYGWTEIADLDLSPEIYPEVIGHGPSQSGFSDIKAQDISYCYVEQVSSVCQVTLRWFPPMIVGLFLLIKGITIFLAVQYLPHFKQRQFNCLGDLILLATKCPEIHSCQNFTPPTVCRPVKIVGGPNLP